ELEKNTEASESVDIEDAVGMDGQPKPLSIVNKRKRQRSGSDWRTPTNFNSQNEESDALIKSWQEVLGSPPKLGKSREEVVEWLKFQKKKWQFQAEQRKHRQRKRARHDGGDGNIRAVGGGVVRRGVSTGLGGFIRKAQRTLLDTPWEIIQLVPESYPGLYKVWALVGGELRLIKLNLPRVFYVNQKIAKPENEGELWKKTTKTLPRSHPSYHLYQYTVPEELYIQHSNELLGELSTPDLEGIYESQVPSDFRAVVQLGCVCSVNRESARRLAATDVDTFELEQLNFRSTAQCSYLETTNLKCMFLYYFNSGNKSMYGLFFPVAKKGHIFVTDTVKSNQMPNINTLYNVERNNKISKGGDPNSLPEAGHTFEIKIETSTKFVHRDIQRLLSAYKNEKRGPTMIAVQSVKEFPDLYMMMPVLADFPLVPIHVRDNDNLYSVLDWQRNGSKAMIRHYLNVESVIKTTTELCRYFHVPLGNLPNDTTLFGADLFYARHLHKHNYVLWASPTARPDLGGKEVDDNRIAVDFEDSDHSLEVNHPGAYSDVCIELDLDGLAVTALLQSQNIQELEGTSSSIAFDVAPQASLQDMMTTGAGASTVGLASYDESALCAGAFRILRSMVNGWLRDVSQFQNVFADFQIIHLYRWLRSPESKLYDPALKRILHNLMKKLFFQLVSEFKRLGAIIIYASFNKVVICTKKRRVVDAVTYVEYIVNNITNKELFHALDINYKQSWDYLLWLDPANHAGIKGKLPQSSSQQNSVESKEELDSSDDEDLPDIEMNWDIGKYLPEEASCQENFKILIAGYISSLYNYNRSQYGCRTPGRTPLQKKTASQAQKAGTSMLADTVKFAQELISGEMSQKLF
ncbi:POLE (predicted), partial [Pycnogonum litorale]